MRKEILLLILSGLWGMGNGGRCTLGAQVPMQEVTRIAFEGNRTFPDQVLANSIITRETDCRSFILTPFCWAGAEFSLDPYHFNQRIFRLDFLRVFRFYLERGYRDVAVDTVVERPSEEEIRLTFRIQEGAPIRVNRISFDGGEEVPDPSVLEGLPLGVGDPLSFILLDATRDTLETRLRNRGFAYADVLRRYNMPTETPYQAEVGFDVYPGPLTRFGPISVEGASAVDESVVRRMLPIREGSLYSQDLRFVGQRNLYNLDIFSFVDIVPQLSDVSDPMVEPDSVVPLLVRVAEGDVHRVRVGSGLSTADCVSAETRWASRNFRGGARRLQLTGRVSNMFAESLENSVCPQAGIGKYGDLNWLVSADFTQPWLLSPRNTLNISVSGEHQSLPDLFVRQALGMNVGVTHTLTVSTPFTFSYRPQISWLEAADVFFCSNYLVCTRSDIEVLQGANLLAPIGMSLSRDRRNQALSPTRGYSALVDLEHAASWTGSEFLYTRLLANGTWYTQNRAGFVLATHLRGGWVNPEGFRGEGVEGAVGRIIHPDKRFYAGGANSVRGFAQNRLGPRVLQVQNVERLLAISDVTGEPVCTPEGIVDLSCDAGDLQDSDFLPIPTGGTSLLEGSVEVRFPFAGPRWEGATFLDFGQVWEEDDGVDLRDIELTPGLGVRFFSPIGPVRVDLAYRFRSGDPLQVVSSQIRPYDPESDDASQRLNGPDGPVDYVRSRELALFDQKVLFGALDTWSLRRFQIHFSIGQAF